METEALTNGTGVARTTAELVGDYEQAFAELTEMADRAKALAVVANALKAEIAQRLGLYGAEPRTGAKCGGSKMAPDTAQRYLAELAPHAPIKGVVFADLLKHPRSRITNALSVLKHKGLVNNDPRTHLWTLTDEGKALLLGAKAVEEANA